MDAKITAEICYIGKKKRYGHTLALRQGTTIAGAIRQSKILEECPEIDWKTHKLGIFNEFRSPDDLVSNGDRIEIYRPLITDPKESRRKRARDKKSS